MKLIVQPDAGVAPIVTSIKQARATIDILIFRLAFLGSQSLRRIELDERREIGVIVTDGSLAKQMQAVFEEDWAQTDPGKRTAKAADKRQRIKRPRIHESDRVAFGLL